MMKLVGDDLYWILAIFKLTLQQGSMKMGANHLKACLTCAKNFKKETTVKVSLIISSDAARNGLLNVKATATFALVS